MRTYRKFKLLGTNLRAHTVSASPPVPPSDGVAGARTPLAGRVPTLNYLGVGQRKNIIVFHLRRANMRDSQFNATSSRHFVFIKLFNI